MVRALAGAAGIAIDNSRLYETARRRRRWLEATAEVTTKLLGGSDTREALHLIARHARELTGADYTLIALPDDVERPTRKVAVLTVAVCVGMGADTITGTHHADRRINGRRGLRRSCDAERRRPRVRPDQGARHRVRPGTGLAVGRR